MKDKLHKYFGQWVEVRAHGVTYTGELVGADEDTLYLKCQTSWVTIPMDRVSSLKPKDKSEGHRIFKKVNGEPESPTEEEKSRKRDAAFKLQIISDEDENN